MQQQSIIKSGCWNVVEDNSTVDEHDLLSDSVSAPVKFR